MSDTNVPHQKNDFDPAELLICLISDLRRPANNGIAYSKLFGLEIPLSEDQQREFQKDISRQFEEISHLLEKYLQILKESHGKTNE